MNRHLRFRHVLMAGRPQATRVAGHPAVAGDQLARVALAVIAQRRLAAAPSTALPLQARAALRQRLPDRGRATMAGQATAGLCTAEDPAAPRAGSLAAQPGAQPAATGPADPSVDDPQEPAAGAPRTPHRPVAGVWAP